MSNISMHSHNLSIKDVVSSQLCIGCGLCSLDVHCNGLVYKKCNDCYVPSLTDIPNDSIANLICPGRGYPIKTIGYKLFGKNGTYDIDLGYYTSYAAIQSTNQKVINKASSGGAITSILIYLLSNHLVDKVGITQFHCDNEGVKTSTFLTDNIDEIIKAQGSKYCPTNFDLLLQEIHNYKGRVAIVATPCTIAGIRQIQEKQPDYITAKIEFLISVFCGGHKSLKNIKSLSRICNVDLHGLANFRFRGGESSDGLYFVERNGRVVHIPYPNYVGMNGYSKMLRCHLCCDATGELADISCGDAWLPELRENSRKWSIAICRNEKAVRLMQNMRNDKIINLKQITIDKIKESQKYNLKSKKTRQMARRSFYHKLGYTLPSFSEEGYPMIETPIRTELTVFMKHKIKLLCEYLKIYSFLYGKKKHRNS